MSEWPSDRIPDHRYPYSIPTDRELLLEIIGRLKKLDQRLLNAMFLRPQPHLEPVPLPHGEFTCHTCGRIHPRNVTTSHHPNGCQCGSKSLHAPDGDNQSQAGCVWSQTFAQRAATPEPHKTYQDSGTIGPERTTGEHES